MIEFLVGPQYLLKYSVYCSNNLTLSIKTVVGYIANRLVPIISVSQASPLSKRITQQVYYFILLGIVDEVHAFLHAPILWKARPVECYPMMLHSIIIVQHILVCLSYGVNTSIIR